MRKRMRIPGKTDKLKISAEQIRILAMLVLVELLFMCYVWLRGYGLRYFPVFVILVPVSLLICYLVYRMKANQMICVWTILLLNTGFMVRMCASSWKDSELKDLLYKCAAALAAAVLAAFVFYYLSYWLSMDIALWGLLILQFLLSLALLLSETTGSTEEQGAYLAVNLNKFSFTPLEIVKVIYIFVMALLLCKEEKSNEKIFGIQRELAAIIYTVATLLSLVLFRELGTFLIIALTGSCMILIYCRNRRFVVKIAAAGVVTALLSAVLCITLHSKVPLLEKVYDRFKYTFSPELDALNKGFQGLQMREAIAVGGFWGPDTPRYMTTIANESSDMIFAKLIQSCGVVMGMIMILGYVFLLREGNNIARKSKDFYYGGLAMGITIMIAAESLVHIGYNIGIFPITGITLYFMSEGFTSVMMGLCMTAILLVISTGSQERSEYDERELEDNLEKVRNRALRKRRRPRH